MSSTASVYPPDLARYVEAHWPAETPLRVSSKHLAAALSAAFQASLTAEEGRTTRFRLLLTPASELPSDEEPNHGVLRLRFERSRPFTADELRRLCPAAPFETSLIAAHPEGDKLRIWGLAHSGPAWLAPSWGGRKLVPNWSYDPIIHVTNPGQLTVRTAGRLIGAIERGELVDTLLDVFESEWLAAMFAREREEVRVAHAATQAELDSPTFVEHSLVSRVGQHMLRRTIQLVRGARQGGMILVVDGAPTGSPQQLDGLRLKYGFEQDEPATRYRSLLLRVVGAVAQASGKHSVGWADFVADNDAQLAKLEAAIFEWSRVVANLTAIDGAVVLDKRLGLIGFGAEVSAELPAPARVFRALDSAGDSVLVDDIESVGTRHRAAYRFVNDHPHGLAIVISHDGGVRFVANRAGEVVFWEQSVSP